jgi:hypothetical protein
MIIDLQFYNSPYHPLMISALENDSISNTQDNQRLEITKKLRIWLKKFSESHPTNRIILSQHNSDNTNRLFCHIVNSK